MLYLIFLQTLKKVKKKYVFIFIQKRPNHDVLNIFTYPSKYLHLQPGPEAASTFLDSSCTSENII